MGGPRSKYRVSTWDADALMAHAEMSVKMIEYARATAEQDFDENLFREAVRAEAAKAEMARAEAAEDKVREQAVRMQAPQDRTVSRELSGADIVDTEDSRSVKLITGAADGELVRSELGSSNSEARELAESTTDSHSGLTWAPRAKRTHVENYRGNDDNVLMGGRVDVHPHDYRQSDSDPVSVGREERLGLSPTLASVGSEWARNVGRRVGPTGGEDVDSLANGLSVSSLETAPKRRSSLSSGMAMSIGWGGDYDASVADKAFRSGRSALESGNARAAVDFLQLAASSCPPDRLSALGKIQRLIEEANREIGMSSVSNRGYVGPSPAVLPSGGTGTNGYFDATHHRGGEEGGGELYAALEEGDGFGEVCGELEGDVDEQHRRVSGDYEDLMWEGSRRREDVSHEKEGRLPGGSATNLAIADEAYRAAVAEFDKGNPALALRHLQAAAAACPVDRRSALGKIQKLFDQAGVMLEG